MRRLRTFLASVLVASTAGLHGSMALLLPFGNSLGDTGMVKPVDSSPAVSLTSSFVLFQDNYTTVYVNVDGFVSFTTPGNIYNISSSLSQSDFPVICVFCADFEPDANSQVWYRLSTETTDLQAIQDLARQYKDFGSTFTPNWVFVMTWDNVGKFGPTTNEGNTIQVSLATNGTTSLVLLEFDYLSWIEGFIGATNYNTQVGFSKGDQTTSYLFPESKSADLWRLNSTTNINRPGFYLFRVDQGTIPPSPTPFATVTSQPNTVPLTQATKYYIGFGVAGGVLLILGIACVVCVKIKSRSSAKVKPAPSKDGNIERQPPVDSPPTQPLRIPRPSASLTPRRL